MELANRVMNLPPYLFAGVDAMIAEARSKGVDVISFGIGDPDIPTPENIVKKAAEEVHNAKNHQYPSYVGMREYRAAVADYYQKYSGVSLDSDKEVLTLIGSKEGIAHLPWALLNPGDIALIPDPAYPVYKTATILCNSLPYLMPLLEENAFLPDLKKIDPQIARKAKLMYLNYPNNPTGAVAPREFFEEVISFARKYDIIVAHDAAYAQIGYDGYKAPSILDIPNAKDVAVEFWSLSKPYNMTGWRIGSLVGNKNVVDALGRIKTNIDSGVFNAVQYAGIEALTGPQGAVDENISIYKRRRDLVVSNLKALGWPVEPPQATFYIWIPVPKGFNSEEFSKHVFMKTGVFFTPGTGYGEYGEGYVRLSLTLSEARIVEGFERLKKADIRFA